MKKFTNWTAARSGASITIAAKDEAGEDVKLIGIHTIAPKGGVIVATDGNGDDVELVMDAPAAALPSSPVPADDLSMGNG